MDWEISEIGPRLVYHVYNSYKACTFANIINSFTTKQLVLQNVCIWWSRPEMGNLLLIMQMKNMNARSSNIVLCSIHCSWRSYNGYTSCTTKLDSIFSRHCNDYDVKTFLNASHKVVTGCCCTVGAEIRHLLALWIVMSLSILSAVCTVYDYCKGHQC